VAKKTKSEAAASHEPPTWRTEEWPFERFLKVKRSGFNPKKADPEDIAKIAESYRVLGIGRAFTVRDDDLLLDGHQSVLAFERLLSGEHKAAKGRPVEWSPPKTVTVRVVSGMTDAVARAYIAAVTHNRVETDHELFAQLILDLHNRVQGALEDDVAALIASVDAVGLSPAEFADYVDLAGFDGQGSGKNGGGPPSPGVPKLTLEFTEPALRDRVKRKLAENARSEKEPHGNVLSRILTEWAKKAGPSTVEPVPQAVDAPKAKPKRKGLKGRVGEG